MTSEVGALIKERRLQRELSQKAVSEYMGFSDVFLSHIEKGLADLPAAHVEKMARILKLDKNEIMKALKKDLGAKLEKRSR